MFIYTLNPAYRVYEGYGKLKLVVNEGTCVDENTDGPQNTATLP